MFLSIAFFNGFWVVLGRVLGGFWERFGTSWRLLGHFWHYFLEWFLHYFLSIWLPRLLGATWFHFGFILMGLSRVGGGQGPSHCCFWRGSGRVLESFWGRLGASLEGIWGRFGAFQVGNQFHWYWCSMELILNFKCVVLCVFSAHATKTYEKKDSCRESLFLDALLLSTLPNVSLQQLSRPAMPFRLMAVLRCLKTQTKIQVSKSKQFKIF